jgi:hypothetical protein
MSTSRLAPTPGIPLVITPDGVRRPVAVSIITLLLALTGKLLIKDKLTRGGPDTFNKRVDHMGVGLVGRTLGSLGIGNIGAELFRLAKPYDMKFIAHDPVRRQGGGGGAGHRAGQPGRGVPPRRRAVRELPADAGDEAPGECRAPRSDEADRLSHQHRARADRRPEGADQGPDRAGASPAPASTCWNPSRPIPTIRSSSSTM